MNLPVARLEMLIWVLIYGGLLTAGLGMALERGGRDFGWGVVAGGATAALAGTVLIWIRSRMSDAAER